MGSSSLVSAVGQLRSEFIGFSAATLKIKDKDTGRLVPFSMNVAQIYAHKRIEEQRRETGRVRAILSKGRQQGMSTYTEGRYYWRVTGSQGKNAYILTHEQPATDNLFGMVERFHDSFPEEFRPTLGASNSKELQFKSLNSGYKVGTAGNKSGGRSSTIHFFHGSEVAFWPNAHEHLSGVLQAVPDANGTEVILESTSNGVGGVYYEKVMEAIAGDGDYELIFVPWYWQPEYRKFFYRKGGERFSHEDIVLDEEEVFLASEYGLDNAQILWRRNKIHELASEDMFKQEYPFTVMESFLASGRGVFAGKWLQSAMDECFSPKMMATIDTKTVIERSDGELKVWNGPVRGKKYFIGADPAEGLIHGDFSTAQVIDENGLQVAEYRAHVEPDLFAVYLRTLGLWYNKAMLIVERNNHGMLVNHNLHSVLGYPRIYQEEAEDHMADGKIVRKYGWMTSSRTKPMIVDHLVALVRDGKSGIASKELIEEMQTYVVDDRGRTNAQFGRHDDLLMAYAIVQYVRSKNVRKKRNFTRQSHTPVDPVTGI